MLLYIILSSISFYNHIIYTLQKQKSKRIIRWTFFLYYIHWNRLIFFASHHLHLIIEISKIRFPNQSCSSLRNNWSKLFNRLYRDFKKVLFEYMLTVCNVLKICQTSLVEMKISRKKLSILKYAFGKVSWSTRLKSGYLQSMKQIPFYLSVNYIYMCKLL